MARSSSASPAVRSSAMIACLPAVRVTKGACGMAATARATGSAGPRTPIDRWAEAVRPLYGGMYDGHHADAASGEQPLHAGAGGGAGESDALGQRLVRQAAVRLQFADDGQIGRVQIHLAFPLGSVVRAQARPGRGPNPRPPERRGSEARAGWHASLAYASPPLDNFTE